MEKKYELLPSEEYGLYRIRATRSFDLIRAGELGGLIASEESLSHYGNCWVGYNAIIQGTAQVRDHAKVQHRAFVGGSACIYERALVKDNAKISGRALVGGSAIVGDNALVYGRAQVRDFALVFGSARVYEHAVVRDNMHVQYSHCTRDISRPENLMMSIKCQTGLETIDRHVYGFKHVRKDLGSLYDPTFKYTVGEYAEVEEYDNNPVNPCTTGLHVSNACFWEGQNENGTKVIKVRVALDDIISVQTGKIRCKRLFVLGVCDSEVF